MPQGKTVVLLLVTVAVALVILLAPRYRWKGPKPWSLLSMLRSGCSKVYRMAGWDCLDTDAARDNLERFDDIMRHHGVRFWLSEGTALGAIREARFIPHDDDVDVAVDAKDLPAFLDRVHPDLERVGFELVKVWNDGNFMTFVRRGEALDVDFVKEGRPCMFLSKGKVGLLRNKCEDLDRYLSHLRRVPFYGRKYWVPGEDYLAHLYGDDWKTPDVSTSRCAPKGRLVCGAGTVEVDGECLPDILCGPHNSLDCIPDVICGEGTEAVRGKCRIADPTRRHAAISPPISEKATAFPATFE